MSDVVAFIRARLDEQEAAARAATWPDETGEWRIAAAGMMVSVTTHGALRDLAFVDSPAEAALVHAAEHDPAWVLRQVAELRAVVDAADLGVSQVPRPAAGSVVSAASMGWVIGDAVLRHLAAIWSDHPDYDPAWTPA